VQPVKKPIPPEVGNFGGGERRELKILFLPTKKKQKSLEDDFLLPLTFFEKEKLEGFLLEGGNLSLHEKD